MTEQAVELVQSRRRIQLRMWEVRIGHAEEVEDQRQRVAEALVEEEQASRDLLARRDRPVEVVDPEVSAQQLEHGMKGGEAAMRLSVRDEHADAGPACVLHQPLPYPPLPHAAPPHHSHPLSPS